MDGCFSRYRPETRLSPSGQTWPVGTSLLLPMRRPETGQSANHPSPTPGALARRSASDHLPGSAERPSRAQTGRKPLFRFRARRTEKRTLRPPVASADTDPVADFRKVRSWQPGVRISAIPEQAQAPRHAPWSGSGHACPCHGPGRSLSTAQAEFDPPAPPTLLVTLTCQTTLLRCEPLNYDRNSIL